MSYRQFLSDLFEHGRVTLEKIAPLSDGDLRDGEEVIADFERQYRLEMPDIPPRFSPSAGGWAAIRLYRACQSAVFRDVDGETIDRELGQPCPEPVTADTHYSVDVLFRYLPDVVRFARWADSDDPLLAHLLRWGRQWPLSSVGMPGLDEVCIDGFADHPSLLRVYADRIIATSDRSRLSDPRAREAVQCALGHHTALAAAIAAALVPDDHQADHQDTIE